MGKISFLFKKSFDCNNAFHPAGRDTGVKANVHALHLSYIHASAISGTFCACKNQNGRFRELLRLKHGFSIGIVCSFRDSYLDTYISISHISHLK